MKILVTGAAGFIGHHLATALVEAGHTVVGLDSVNDYYDPALKYARLEAAGISRSEIETGLYVQSSAYDTYRFMKLDLTDRESLDAVMVEERFDLVCHMAAQAGVRYSLENPHAYGDSNLTAFLNILEGCRGGAGRRGEGGSAREASSGRTAPIPLVYASSSSVYGQNRKVPFAESDRVEQPVSLYAATKRANELMAHSYSHLYGLPAVGLRFFTVYGPWGRPDMAPILFADAISGGRPLKVFNHGDMQRDFTYIDDIVEGILRVVSGIEGGAAAPVFRRPAPQIEHTDERGPGQPPHRIYNIGHGSPVKLMDFIAEMEKALGQEAKKNYLPMQPGDVPVTWADTGALERDFGYKPATRLTEGIRRFVGWYREYYGR